MVIIGHHFELLVLIVRLKSIYSIIGKDAVKFNSRIFYFVFIIYANFSAVCFHEEIFNPKDLLLCVW